MAERKGDQTVRLTSPVHVIASAAAGGEKESSGPLKTCFDYLSSDSYFGQETWEKAESEMLRRCLEICLRKSALRSGSPQCILGGDLLNQCVSSSFAVKDSGVPYFGLYGACSTMAESLALAALMIDGAELRPPALSPALTSALRKGSTVSRSNTAVSAPPHRSGRSPVPAPSCSADRAAALP